jgi:hypothetical protein
MSIFCGYNYKLHLGIEALSIIYYYIWRLWMLYSFDRVLVCFEILYVTYSCVISSKILIFASWLGN